jgi:hypothetical protein
MEEENKVTFESDELELPEITEEHVTEEARKQHEAMVAQMAALKEKYLSSVFRGSITGRQAVNVEIVAKLLEAIEAQPDARFSQLLLTTGIVQADDDNLGCWVDDFYLESRELLGRVK